MFQQFAVKLGELRAAQPLVSILSFAEKRSFSANRAAKPQKP